MNNIKYFLTVTSIFLTVFVTLTKLMDFNGINNFNKINIVIQIIFPILFFLFLISISDIVIKNKKNKIQEIFYMNIQYKNTDILYLYKFNKFLINEKLSYLILNEMKSKLHIQEDEFALYIKKRFLLRNKIKLSFINLLSK